VGGGHTLGDAAQDLENNGTGIAAFAKERAGEEVENGPATAAAVIDHDAMAVMRGLGGRQRMPVGTLQTVRLEQVK
jgi:hypothetical protein